MDNKSQFTVDAEKLLERMKLGPPREPGEALRPEDVETILALADDGLNQTEIAKQVGCSQPTVSRTIAEYRDTRPLARKRLEGSALAMTDDVITNGSPDLKFKALQKLDVVRDDRPSIGGDVGIQVVIGMPANWTHERAIAEMSANVKVTQDSQAPERATGGTVDAVVVAAESARSSSDD